MSSEMGINRKARALFSLVGKSSFGPKVNNPVYEIASRDGRALYRVARYPLTDPLVRWVWCATTHGRPDVCGETLEEVAKQLGYEVEE